MLNQYINLHKVIQGAFNERIKIPEAYPSHIYPSSCSAKVKDKFGNTRVIGNCLRKVYLSYIHEPKSEQRKGAETIGSWEIGNLIQDFIENQFKKMGVYLQNELKIYIPQWNVSGRADTILVIPDDKEKGKLNYVGVEIKSKAGYQAKVQYIEPRKADPAHEFRPADDHLMQAMTYLFAFDTLPHLKQYNIKRWMILYVLRDAGEYNYFEVELTKDSKKYPYGYPVIYSKLLPEGFVYTDFKMEDIVRRWEELLWHVDNNVLPPRDFKTYYEPEDWRKKVANGELGKTETELVNAEKWARLTVDINGTEESKGDSECRYCDYRAKCNKTREYTCKTDDQVFVMTKVKPTFKYSNNLTCFKPEGNK